MSDLWPISLIVAMTIAATVYEAMHGAWLIVALGVLAVAGWLLVASDV